MISTLHIKNIGIIDNLTINLNEGLNVLTGETGAGKTLIVDSLAIIAGGRFSKEMIRKGEINSFVELCLYLPNNEKAIDGNIIISREINITGRNMCKINGRMVTVTELKDFMKELIDIHGQFDNQILMDKSYHTKYLDDFIGEQIKELKKQYIELFLEYKKIKNKLTSNFTDEKEKQRQLDLLQYQLNEINVAELSLTEENELEEKRKIILNSAKVFENLNNVNNNLNENAIDIINDSIKSLEKIEFIDKKYEQKLSELKNIYYDIQELGRDISNMKNNIFFDETQRNNIEERLDLIYSLKRKYGNSIEEILKYKDNIEKQINKIQNLDEENLKLETQLEIVKKAMIQLTNKIDLLRKQYSIKLNEKINNELKDLEMKNSKFNAKVINEVEFTENGLTHIEFLISTNIGEDEKPLNKIASGGEISRIMLAIKTVLSDIDKVSVLIFDEIDTGISGKVATAVGEKLKIIAKEHQVLIVTHLATIAAKGEYNYYIYKETKNNKTKTKIKQLTENETINEIARIASGEITKIAISHAKELRKSQVA